MESSSEMLERRVNVLWYADVDMQARHATNTPTGAIYADESEVIIGANTSFLHNSVTSSGGKSCSRSWSPASDLGREVDGYPEQCQ